jgi:hypothetical protein
MSDKVKFVGEDTIRLAIRVNELEAENKELASDYQSIGDELAGARRQIAELKAVNADLRSDNIDLSADVAKKDKIIEILESVADAAKDLNDWLDAAKEASVKDKTLTLEMFVMRVMVAKYDLVQAIAALEPDEEITGFEEKLEADNE